MTRAVDNRQDRERGHDDPPDGWTVSEWLEHRARVRARQRLRAAQRARLRGRGMARADIDRAMDLYND